MNAQVVRQPGELNTSEMQVVKAILSSNTESNLDTNGHVGTVPHLTQDHAHGFNLENDDDDDDEYDE